MQAYAVYKTNGTLWRAGKGIYGLCSAYNHATNPSKPMTDVEHKKSYRYARAIKNRMNRLGFAYGTHYKELSDSSLWPIKA
jgi:hypothetical protein